MKKIIFALSLFCFLTAGVISATEIQHTKVSAMETTFVLADDNASIFAYTDGDDEKDKKKKSSKGDAKDSCKEKKSCCSKSKSSGVSSKSCATKKSCGTKKSETNDKGDK